MKCNNCLELGLPLYGGVCPNCLEALRSGAGGGKKHDQDKPMMALLTPEFLEETAKVLTFGAAKYEKYNWAKGMSWSRPFGALMRHAWAWWGGEDKDPETGLSHLAHCACNLLFLLHYEKFKKGEDDRYKPV